MAVTDDPVAAIIALAKQCLCNSLDDLCSCCGHSGPPAPPAADCCDCGGGASGRAFIQVGRVYPVGSPFPAEAASTSPCGGSRLAVEFSVTLYRCVGTIDDNGVHPSCETTTFEMFRNLEDMQAVRSAMLCCLREEAGSTNGFQIKMVDQTPLVPDGGCGGTVSSFVASADWGILRVPALLAL